jgi:release factor glutamine methyltransferase
MIDARRITASQEEPENRDLDAWTIGRLLGWTSEYLKRKGSESPRLDAEVMLAHVLERQRVELYTHFNDEVKESARAGFRELVVRRAAGSPVAYLVGRKEFFSLAFEVSPDVLIPRPESEFVVTEYLAISSQLKSPRCVDVGTGSGCLAIAAAHRQPGAHFVAIDACERALAVARRNAARHGVADRIDFRRGDRLAPVAGEGPFDAIISNPPYIASEQWGELEAGVKDYEPRLALDGGPGGLAMVAALIEEAPDLLNPGGHLVLEIGTAQEQPVRALIERQPRLRLAQSVYDLAKHPRVIRATRIDDPA